MKAILFVVLLSVIGLGYSELSCPKVFDGLTNGHFDLATQFSVSEISANWVGLSSNQILGYDWAIVSDAKVNKAPGLLIIFLQRKTITFFTKSYDIN